MYMMSEANTEELGELFFFFQAEDGIRDLTVTGVQTCALPICWSSSSEIRQPGRCDRARGAGRAGGAVRSRHRRRAAIQLRRPAAADRRHRPDRKSVV